MEDMQKEKWEENLGHHGGKRAGSEVRTGKREKGKKKPWGSGEKKEASPPLRLGKKNCQGGKTKVFRRQPGKRRGGNHLKPHYRAIQRKQA